MTTDFVTPTTYTFNDAKTRSTARRAQPITHAPDEAPAFPTTPIYARTRKSSAMGGASPASIIGGGVVLAVFAAGIFAISQAGSEPAGLSEPTQIAAAPMAPAAPLTAPVDAGPPVMTEAESAAAEAAAQRAAAPTDPAPAVKPAATAPAAKPATRAAVAIPAAPPAAAESAEDAAAMLPEGPMPYVPDTATNGVVTPPPIVSPPAESQAPATAVGAETPMVPAMETTPLP